MVKKFLVLALVAALLVGGIGLSGKSAAKAADKPVLVVSTWGYNQDLLDKNITIPFQDKYDVEIVYETGNNSERLSKMVERGDDPGVDVVHFADSYAYTAYQEGLLQPYNPDLLPSLGDLYDWAVDPIGGQYAVGYAVSSYGLFYRTDEVKEPITSWKDLWRSDVKGYVTVPDMGTTNGPATLLMMARAWGGDIDNLEPAWENLPDLVDQLLTTYVRSSELTSLVQQEEVWVGSVPSFSFPALTDTGLPLEFVIPEEGLAGFQSVVSVVKGTKQEELAHEYIDFLISHDVQLAEAMDLVDSPTNMTVEVPDDVAAKLTYGQDMINSLTFMDSAFVSDHLEEWITRWNELLVQ